MRAITPGKFSTTTSRRSQGARHARPSGWIDTERLPALTRTSTCSIARPDRGRAACRRRMRLSPDGAARGAGCPASTPVVENRDPAGSRARHSATIGDAAPQGGCYRTGPRGSSRGAELPFRTRGCAPGDSSAACPPQILDSRLVAAVWAPSGFVARWIAARPHPLAAARRRGRGRLRSVWPLIRDPNGGLTSGAGAPPAARVIRSLPILLRSICAGSSGVLDQAARDPLVVRRAPALGPLGVQIRPPSACRRVDAVA
jgi:hypothetical protein